MSNRHWRRDLSSWSVCIATIKKNQQQASRRFAASIIPRNYQEFHEKLMNQRMQVLQT